MRRSTMILLAGSLCLPVPISFAAEAPVRVDVRVHVAPPPAPAPEPEQDRPLVQVALLLDTSNSMDGLIQQARTQLWNIVNEISSTRRSGKLPRLEIALFEYGNDSISEGEQHVRMVLGFTSDLDRVSEALFALTTNGGSEYCGTVIDSALRTLKWSDDPGAYRVMFIAGNEPFTQGQVDYRESIASAVRRSIVVNTIHCGSDEQGRVGMWADGAKIGGGEYLWIDQDRRVIVCPAPQDEPILQLNIRLNSTYVPYGARGHEGATRQVAMDEANARESESGALVARAAAKASANYDAGGWDLVDAWAAGRVKLAELDRKTLPKELQSLDEEALASHLREQLSLRTEIQEQIRKLSADRAKFLAEQRPASPEPDAASLEDASLNAVRKQMRERGYE